MSATNAKKLCLIRCELRPERLRLKRLYPPRNPQVESGTGQAKEGRPRQDKMTTSTITRILRNTIGTAMLAGALLIAPQAAQARVFVSVGFAPPAIPVYTQPICPGDGYIWTPGYWAYTDDGYQWVDGAWVLAPYTGALWTPGYWGYDGGAYVWNAGYWGPTVGYYGGLNYGFGYFGVGFYGGYWNHGAFFYNRAYNHFGAGFRGDHFYNQRYGNFDGRPGGTSFARGGGFGGNRGGTLSTSVFRTGVGNTGARQGGFNQANLGGNNGTTNSMGRGNGFVGNRGGFGQTQQLQNRGGNGFAGNNNVQRNDMGSNFHANPTAGSRAPAQQSFHAPAAQASHAPTQSFHAPSGSGSHGGGGGGFRSGSGSHGGHR